MEVRSPEIKTSDPIEARACYPPRADLFDEFEQRVRSGRLTLTQAERSEATVMVPTWDFEKQYPDIDFSYLEPNEEYSKDEVLNGLNDEQKAAFLQNEEEKILKACFQVDLSQGAKAWWIGVNPERDTYEWLDNAKLFAIYEVEIGNEQFLVNDFSGKINIEEVAQGIREVASMLEAKGVNLASFLRVINIQPENFQLFQVPEEILKTHPKAFVAANANKQRGILDFNEKAILKEPSDKNEDDFVVAENWRTTLMHELGHLFNMGLQDSNDASYAQEIGWDIKVDYADDGYGNLHKVNKKQRFVGLGDRTVDNYGTEIYVSEGDLPKIFIQGYKDAKGKTVKPPSQYAQTADYEDIAESFAAYFFAPEKLDEVRKSMIERLLAANQQEGLEPGQEVTLKKFDLNNFNPWDEILPKQIKYERRSYRGPLRPRNVSV